MNNAVDAVIEERKKLRDSGVDDKTCTLKEVHFRQELAKISPSVSEKVGLQLTCDLLKW